MEKPVSTSATLSRSLPCRYCEGGGELCTRCVYSEGTGGRENHFSASVQPPRKKDAKKEKRRRGQRERRKERRA